MELIYKKICGKILYFLAKIYTPQFEGRYYSDFKQQFQNYKFYFIFSISYYPPLFCIMYNNFNYFSLPKSTTLLGATECLFLIIATKQLIDLGSSKIDKILKVNSLQILWDNQKTRFLVPLIGYYCFFICLFLCANFSTLLLLNKHSVVFLENITWIENIFLLRFLSIIASSIKTSGSAALTLSVAFLFLIIGSFFLKTLNAIITKNKDNKIKFLYIKPKIRDEDIVINPSKKPSVRELDKLFSK